MTKHEELVERVRKQAIEPRLTHSSGWQDRAARAAVDIVRREFGAGFREGLEAALHKVEVSDDLDSACAAIRHLQNTHKETDRG